MNVLDWEVLDCPLAWLVVVLLPDLPGYLVSQHSNYEIIKCQVKAGQDDLLRTLRVSTKTFL